jgi:LPXTG-motif cell wall-anchored protein
MKDYFESITLALLGIVGGGASGFFFGKKKNQKEVESIAIHTAEKAISVYQNTLNDLEIRFDKRINSLEKELHNCRAAMQEELEKSRQKRDNKGRFA